MKNQSGKFIIIRIDKGKIYFNDSLFLDVKYSNLPLESIDFKNVTNTYWELEQLKFVKDSQTLFVKINNYFITDIAPLENQKPRSKISRIEFENLWDAENLKRCLNYYKTKIITEHSKEDMMFMQPDGTFRKDKTSDDTELTLFPPKEEFTKKFKIYFRDAEFKLGYVTFEKYIPEAGQKLRFKVINDFILGEFEFIKSYFARSLGSKKFDVKVKIYMENGKVTGTSASSLMIQKIDQHLIESVKNLRTQSITRPPGFFKPDKSLFSSDEIFNEFGGEQEGNIFNQDEMEILQQLLKEKNVRNRKQIEYLAGLKQAPAAKLKFTLHPYFGFLFTIRGERMNHFVWELLNSHATYVWSLGKSDTELRIQYRRVEESINNIRNSGRESYKMAYRDNHLDQDLVFNVIKHEDVSSFFIEGFVKWKHRLNELIV
jgi:hypothetical protein